MFFIATNEGAKNFKLMRASLEDLDKAYWHEVIPHREDVLLEGLQGLRYAELETTIEAGNTIRLRTQNIGRLRLMLRRELVPSPDAPMRVLWNDRTVFEGPFTEDCGLFARTAQAVADPQRAWSMELTLDRPR